MTKSPLTRRFTNKTKTTYGLQYETKILQHFLSLALHLQLYFSFIQPASYTHTEFSVYCRGSSHKSTNIQLAVPGITGKGIDKERNKVLEIQQISYTIHGQKEKDEGSTSKITQRRLKMNITKVNIWFNRLAKGFGVSRQCFFSFFQKVLIRKG